MIPIRRKYTHTLQNFKKNTGKEHPLTSLVNTSGIAKRATGSDALTDSSDVLWYGNIDVGTPPVTYTVDFDTYVVLHLKLMTVDTCI
jgi:cathepsin D